MPLGAIDGILLGLNGRDEWRPLHVLIGRQDVEEVNEERKVVEVLRGDTKLMVVISDVLTGDDLLQVIRHGREQLALGGSRSKSESQVDVGTVVGTIKDGGIVCSQANKLFKLNTHTHTHTHET